MDFDLKAGTAILERTPARCARCSPGSRPYGPGDRGPETESLRHRGPPDRRARHKIPRARIILAQGSDRRFTPYDRFAQFLESQGKSLANLLDEFEQLRGENLRTLAGWKLTEEQLSLEGEHPEFGRVTLRQLLATWVVHDVGHVAQTARVMAKQYREAIGPWRAYLPIVDR
jgi:hypothetical protein